MLRPVGGWICRFAAGPILAARSRLPQQGGFYARDGHALAIVLSKDLGRFFGAARIIELRTADERDAGAQQFIVESGVSISCAIVIMPVGQAGKRSPRPSR